MLGIHIIRIMNLDKLDLNLLVVFDALMQERNVTRAAARIGISQPSMSHALTRLRAHWGEPLFVRTRQGMEPTAFAQQIAPAVNKGLALLQSGLDRASVFDPSVSKRTFHLLLSDIGEIAYLPRILARLKTDAPHVSVRALMLPREQYQGAFEAGEADLAIGFLPALQEGFYQQRLLTDSYVCLVRGDHPRIADVLDVRQFLDEAHVAVEAGGSRYNPSVSDLSTTTLIERHLGEMGVHRTIIVRVPHFVVVPSIVQATDLLAVVPSYLVSSMAGIQNLKVLPLPFDVPAFDVKQFWHKRTHRDAANRWLRGVVADLFMAKR